MPAAAAPRCAAARTPPPAPACCDAALSAAFPPLTVLLAAPTPRVRRAPAPQPRSLQDNEETLLDYEEVEDDKADAGPAAAGAGGKS
jgi:hypothetical protein